MPMMMRRMGRAAVTTAVVAGTAGAVHHHQEQKYANQAAQQQAAAAPPPQEYVEPAPAPAAPAVDPQTAQLENLANLHAQGILTDEEYAAAKAKALGI
jgi:hypothetical protein